MGSDRSRAQTLLLTTGFGGIFRAIRYSRHRLAIRYHQRILAAFIPCLRAIWPLSKCPHFLKQSLILLPGV